MNILLFLIAFSLCTPALYLFVLTCAAFYRRVFAQKQANANLGLGHIVFIVPAHNEEKGLQKTITSLKQCLCTDPDASIHVIADNCTDNTALIAKNNEVNTWERFDDVHKSKGYALEWVIPQIFAWGKINNKNIVCVAIVDADCSLSANSLTIARSFLATGAQAMQSENMMLGNPNALASIGVIGMAAMNVVRGLGRLQLGLSDILKGTGVWLSSDVLQKFPWKAATLAEDLEYSILLAQNNITVKFMPNSICLSEPPKTKQALQTQRQRWESGRLSMVMQTLPNLFKAYINKPSLNTLNIIFDLLTPPLGLLVFIYACGLFSYFIIPSLIACFSFVSLLLITMHVLLTIPLARLDNKYYLYLLYTPFYILWKIILLPKIIASRASKKWVRTER